MKKIEQGVRHTFQGLKMRVPHFPSACVFAKVITEILLERRQENARDFAQVRSHAYYPIRLAYALLLIFIFIYLISNFTTRFGCGKGFIFCFFGSARDRKTLWNKPQWFFLLNLEIYMYGVAPEQNVSYLGNASLNNYHTTKRAKETLHFIFTDIIFYKTKIKRELVTIDTFLQDNSY